MFYIQLPDGQFINQPFHSIQEARVYCVRHQIHGYQFLDENQIEELRNQNQQPQRQRNDSIIRKPFIGSNPRGYVPTAKPSVAPNNVRQYQPIRPYFKPKKSYLGRRRKK